MYHLLALLFAAAPIASTLLVLIREGFGEDPRFEGRKLDFRS